MTEYTKEQLHSDLEALRKLGFLEVIGINDDGEWLWAATDKLKEMSDDERFSLIFEQAALEIEQEDQKDD